MAFYVSNVTTRFQAPTVADVLEGNKVLEKIKRKVVEFQYPVLNDPMELVGYCDASWAKTGNSGVSIGGFVWLIGNPKNNRFHVIGWRCRKPKRICHSNFAAETMIASDTLEELFGLRELWLSLVVTTPVTVLKTDCPPLHDHVVHRKQVTEKRLTVDLDTIAERLSLQELSRFK